jgi:hypothetical protein
MRSRWRHLTEEGRLISDDDKRWDDRTDRMTFEVRKGDTTVRSVWTNSVRNAFRKQAGWAKLQKVRQRQRRIGRHVCGIVITNAGCRRRRKERKRQRVGVSKMKGSWARNALRIWIRGEWGDRRQVRGVRTSSSEKDPAEKRLESG